MRLSFLYSMICIFLLFCFSLTTNSYCQTTVEEDADYWNEEKAEQSKEKEKQVKAADENSTRLPDANRVNYSLAMGGIYGFGGNNGFSSFLAPEVGYNLTGKFSIGVGTMFIRSTQMGNTDSETNTSNGISNSNLIYVKGSYAVSERFRVNGLVLFETPLSQTTNSTNQFNNKSFIVGGEYKFNDSFSVGFDVGFSDRPHNYSPFNQGYSPMNRGYHGFGW